ncbi:hypothetical protein TgHK011_008236 [Trichoderma gracile]|nr:hypothetical protein TgHK011_008236 [Trichoderma gracile]
MLSNRDIVALQKIYDHSYLSCSKAVYYEDQSWNYNARKRLDLLEALRLSREDSCAASASRDYTPTTAQASGSTNQASGTIGQGNDSRRQILGTFVLSSPKDFPRRNDACGGGWAKQGGDVGMELLGSPKQLPEALCSRGPVAKIKPCTAPIDGTRLAQFTKADASLRAKIVTHIASEMEHGDRDRRDSPPTTVGLVYQRSVKRTNVFGQAETAMLYQTPSKSEQYQTPRRSFGFEETPSQSRRGSTKAGTGSYFGTSAGQKGSSSTTRSKRFDEDSPLLYKYDTQRGDGLRDDTRQSYLYTSSYGVETPRTRPSP